jgi:hypothetical protein
LAHHPVELVLELPDGGLGREEEGLAHAADKEAVVAPAVGYEVHGDGASAGRGAVDDDVVGVAAELDGQLNALPLI